MSHAIIKALGASLLSLSFAWSAAAGGDVPADDTAPSCDIRVAYEGTSIVLEGLVFAPLPVSGVYEMQISQGGHAGQSDIRQSGDFEAVPGADGSLGIVSLSHSSGYVATLTVHWDDGTPDCTRQVGTGRQL